MITVRGLFPSIAKLAVRVGSTDIAARPLRRKLSAHPGIRKWIATRGSRTMLRRLSIRLLPFRFGDQNRLVVQDSNKARSVSTGRTIDSIRPDGCECEVRSQFYKGPVRGDQRVGFFRNRNPGRSVVKRLPAQQRWSPDFLLATSFPLLGLEPNWRYHDRLKHPGTDRRR